MADEALPQDHENVRNTVMNRSATGTDVRTEVDTVPRAAAAPLRAPMAERIRWGPIWAGLVMTFSPFLVLEALLFTIGAPSFNKLPIGRSWSPPIATKL
jgi:hypothetical protein